MLVSVELQLAIEATLITSVVSAILVELLFQMQTKVITTSDLLIPVAVL